MGNEIEQSVRKSSNYESWSLEPEEKLSNLSWKQLVHHLGGWGLLAASAHNMQPWLLKDDETARTLAVSPREKYMGTASDKKGRQAQIGVGCFAANLRTALEGYGSEPAFKITDKKNSRAEIIFDLTDVGNTVLQDSGVFEIMKQRRAYRGHYQVGGSLGADLERVLKKIARQEGVRLDMITDRASKSVLAELQELADRAVLMVGEFRHELAEYMRPSDTLETRVMPANTFRIPPDVALELEEALAKNGQFPGKFADALGRDDFDKVREAAAVAVISVKEDSPHEWIKAGMALELMWLKLVERDLGVAIMAGMVESLAENMVLKARLGMTLGRLRPAAVFRFGLPVENVPHSPRVKVHELFEPES